MIRKVTSKDHEQLMAYLSEEKAMNLFMIGDVEAFGYDADFQELWADFNEKGDIQGVLLRFYHGYIPYAKETIDVEAFASIMIKDEKFESFSGKEAITVQFEDVPGLRLKKRKSTYFAECVDADKLDPTIDRINVKIAELDDVDRIIEMRRQIPEFDIQASAREMLMDQMKAGVGRTYFIEEKGKMVATASTTAENSLSAMVVGVCTLNGYRQKGYASLLMNALCRDILEEGKTLCLFYDNPKAGSIYHRLGFQDIGRWAMYR